MTIREFIGVVDAGLTIVVEKDGETIADFDVAYVDSIIDEILDAEIGHIDISAAYKAGTTVTITEVSTDEPDDDGDGNDGGNDGDGGNGGDDN